MIYRTILKYSFLSFIITALYLLAVPYLAEMTRISEVSYLMALITPIVVYFAIREAAIKHWRFKVYFFKSILIGGAIGLISVLLVTLGQCLLDILKGDGFSIDLPFTVFFIGWRVGIGLFSSILVYFILKYKMRIKN